MRLLLLLLGVEQAAVASEQQFRSCPRVFVYPLQYPLQDLPDISINVEGVLGAPVKGQKALRQTNQYSLASLLLAKLTAATSTCRTDDAQKADIFFIPVLAAPKSKVQWEAACARVNSSLLEAQLLHLTPQTACRHFLVVSKGHYNGRACDWWRRPHGLLSHVTRLAYSHSVSEKEVRRLTT